MKKLNKVLIIILVISLISACGFINEGESSENKDIEANSEQTVSEISKYDDLEVNQPHLSATIVKEDVETGETETNGTRVYNKSGQLLERSTIEDGEVVHYKKRKYDKEGRVKVHIEPRYGVKGKEELTKIYQYDKDGKKISCIMKNKEGKKVGEISYEYYENGNLKYKNIEKNYKGYEREIYYNERGHKTKQITQDMMLGKAISKFEQKYDEDGNRIKKKKVTETEIGDGSQISIWYYNKFGKSKKYIRKNGDKIKRWFEREYDEDGNEIKSVSRNSNGKVEEVRKYEYDNRGNMIKEKRINIVEGEEKINLWFEHKYNEDNRLIKSLFKSPEGEVGTIKKYKYEKVNEGENK